MLSRGQLGLQLLHITLLLLQKEAEMQRPTRQITKGPTKNKKQQLVITEIRCSQEIKSTPTTAHTINISFVFA